MSQQPQQIAGRYEVRPLEGGGMGRIWQGYDTVLDRIVAIKQIHAERYVSAEMRQELADRFRREARITAKIEHPGVPAVYDAAIDKDTDDVEQLYLVMQFVHGVTVADLLAENGPLPVSWAVAIAAQVCTVLSYAHAIPVVHRDLKPSNVMVDRSGNVKVLDFGVAAVLGTDVTRLTQSGQMIGSRDYMSPEQFHGVGISPRSDLYALGCLLHEMLAGAKVFGGNRDAALQHVHDRPTPLRTLRADVTEAIERLVLDLLAKAPDDRPSSAQEVFDRLAPFLPTSGLRDTTGSDGVSDPTTPYRRPLAPRRLVTAATTPVDRFPVPPTLWPRVVELLDAADEQATELIDAERFTSAVGLLDRVLSLPEVRSVAEHIRVLETRGTHAGALFLGGDYRRALTEFDALAAAYARVAGPRDERTIECRLHAAYCHAELGDTDAALTAFRALLADTPDDTEALGLRKQIGILLLAANRTLEAADLLRLLERDYLDRYGPNDPNLHDVRDLLARIRFTDDTRP